MTVATRDGWRRVTRDRPCPICGRPDACKVTTDGTMAMCKREPHGAVKTLKGDWYIHSVNGHANGNGHAGGNGTGYVGKAHRSPSAATKPSARSAPKLHPTSDEAIEAARRQIQGAKLTRVWDYYAADGESVVMRVARFDLPDGDKQFRPVHPKKKSWKIGDPSGPLPLYRLPDLREYDGPVYLCEGEKAADAAASLELNATTSAHGADGADKTDWSPLAGRDVVILPDHDQAGGKYARACSRLLLKLDPPARVKVVELPGLPDGGDIVEYVEARPDEPEEQVRAQIEAMAAAAPYLDPADVIGGLKVVCMADVVLKPVSWLWEHNIPLGKITVLAGDPGTGKSFLAAADFAARVSTGTPWPADGAVCPKGDVLIFAVEDDAADTILPRLMAHQADLSRVHAVECVRRVGEDGQATEREFSLADIPDLEREVRRRPDLKLVVIDPVSSFMGGTDGNDNIKVRTLIRPLKRLAEQSGAAFVLVTHLSKSSGASAVKAVIGSIGLPGFARVSWQVTKDKDNPARRLLTVAKSNVGQDKHGYAYRLVESNNMPGIWVVSWEAGRIEMTGDAALAASTNTNEDDNDRAEVRAQAAAWLDEYLQAGPQSWAKIEDDGGQAGHSARTLERARGDVANHFRCSVDHRYYWRRQGDTNTDPPSPV